MLCRQPYISDLLFYGVSASFLAYITFVLSADARHKGVSFPFGSLPIR